MTTDAELIRASSSDSAAFRTLYDRYVIGAGLLGEYAPTPGRG